MKYTLTYARRDGDRPGVGDNLADIHTAVTEVPTQEEFEILCGAVDALIQTCLAHDEYDNRLDAYVAMRQERAS